MFYTVHLMSDDIERATLEMCDPHVKTVLFNSHCWSSYGVLSATSLADSLLHWRLPSTIFLGKFGGSQETATQILKIARLDSVFNRLVRMSDRFSRPVICSKTFYLL